MIIILISFIAGISDTATGFGLILIPERVLELMGIDSADYPMSMIQFIGTFVLGTGSLYLWGLFLFRKTGRWELLKLTWLTTGWLRACVAVVTGYMVLLGNLSSAWQSVPLTDGLLAVLQLGWIGLRKFPEDE